MIEDIISVAGVIVIAITLVIVIFHYGKCPDCGGKLIDDDYDENIGKIVWTCKKCGTKWILY